MEVYKKLGFTLVEVLITLGVIGVVSAITMPGLISNVQKSQTEAQLKENYSNIAQAMRFAIYEEVQGISISANSTTSMKKWSDAYLAPHLKVELVCYQTACCWHKRGVVKTLNNKTPNFETNVVADGSTIGWAIMPFRTGKGAYFNLHGSTSGTTSSLFGIDSTKTSTMQFYFDVNDDRKPNIIGKDIFILVYDTEKGLIPAGNDRSAAQVKQNCETGNGYCCLKYIKDNGWSIPDKIWKRRS